ncbi:MAG: hypothetical protein ACOC34_00270 [Thermotogota bacterium]
MKILKFFGWALLGLFVLFLVLLIIMAVFDYTTDDTEVKTVERKTNPMTEDCIKLFSAYLQKENGITILEELLSNAVDSDLVLFQNGEEALSKKIESEFEFHNVYFSFTKRSPVSFSSAGRVSFMDFSGMYSLSSFSPKNVRKLLLPTDTNWFNSLLSPTPALQILEFENKGKSLYVINLDNEMCGQMESQEINTLRLDYIKHSIIETFPQDACIVIAGNWQNTFPGQSITKEEGNGNDNLIPSDWTKTGWQWVYHPEEMSGYGVLVSETIQIENIEFLSSASENSPTAISLLLCLE